MTTSIPSTLLVRVLSVRPRLTLTEVQLVDGILFYRHIDARDHVPTEVRAIRPSPANWTDLRLVLDHAGFWSWPRRWPRCDDGYKGEFAVALGWDCRAARSAGPIGAAAEVDAVIDGVHRLVGDSPNTTDKAEPSTTLVWVPTERIASCVPDAGPALGLK